MHTDIRKVVCLGIAEGRNVFCSIEYVLGRLSISGVVGPRKNGDCTGGCGQIVGQPIEKYNTDEGWNRSKVEQFYTVWRTYHLNNLHAGTPKQERALAQRAVARHQQDHVYNYRDACDYLKDIFLYVDEGHTYGHGWLTEDIPEDVLLYLSDLPDTKKSYAWV